jgi:hypothetical protein
MQNPLSQQVVNDVRRENAESHIGIGESAGAILLPYSHHSK